MCLCFFSFSVLEKEKRLLEEVNPWVRGDGPGRTCRGTFCFIPGITT